MPLSRHGMPLVPWCLAGAALLASGISTHFESADRARGLVDEQAYPQLEALLQANDQILRIGSIYPDWGYLTAETSAAAEASHWAPFHTEALEHLEESYGGLWSGHAQRVFVFLCGLVAHGAMDDPWHFGPQAFLTEAESRDLAGVDPAIASWIVEPAVDLFVQADHRPGDERLRWWVPVADLVAISARAGHPEVDGPRIVLGTQVQRVGLWLEDRFGPSFAALVAFGLPWTAANYEAWPHGGLDDGSELSARRLEAYWDEWQLVRALPDAPAGPPASERRGLRCHESPFLELAEELVRSGVVEVPQADAGQGAVWLEEPRITRPREFRDRLDRAFRFGR
jgi:hypothetical protein